MLCLKRPDQKMDHHSTSFFLNNFCCCKKAPNDLTPMSENKLIMTVIEQGQKYLFLLDSYNLPNYSGNLENRL